MRLRMSRHAALGVLSLLSLFFLVPLIFFVSLFLLVFFVCRHRSPHTRRVTPTDTLGFLRFHFHAVLRRTTMSTRLHRSFAVQGAAPCCCRTPASLVPLQQSRSVAVACRRHGDGRRAGGGWQWARDDQEIPRARGDRHVVSGSWVALGATPNRGNCSPCWLSVGFLRMAIVHHDSFFVRVSRRRCSLLRCLRGRRAKDNCPELRDGGRPSRWRGLALELVVVFVTSLVLLFYSYNTFLVFCLRSTISILHFV